MHRTFAILFTLLIAPSCVLADTVWISGGGPNALEMKNVRVTGIADGKLLFQTSGRDTSRDLATVQRIAIDDEPAVTSAEEAFVAGKFDVAATSYAAALQSTKKPWLKPRLSERLAEAQQRSGRPVPQAPAVATPQRPTPAAPAATPPPAAVQPPAQPSAAAQQKLAAAAAALAQKNFAAAVNEINANRAAFTDPQSQAQALYYLADAQAGLAAAKSDAQSWQDIALAYMRVAAHFPGNPLSAQALMQSAQIQQQKLNDADAARALYRQVIDQYPGNPAANAAREQLK